MKLSETFCTYGKFTQGRPWLQYVSSGFTIHRREIGWFYMSTTIHMYSCSVTGTTSHSSVLRAYLSGLSVVAGGAGSRCWAKGTTLSGCSSLFCWVGSDSQNLRTCKVASYSIVVWKCWVGSLQSGKLLHSTVNALLLIRDAPPPPYWQIFKQGTMKNVPLYLYNITNTITSSNCVCIRICAYINLSMYFLISCLCT